ncbi:MAG: hypothetical protein ACRDZX_02680 [Acidimicrobiales bacterium]
MSGSVGLVDTSCLTADDCWTVGAYFTGKQLATANGLIEHYNGRTWAPATIPDPVGAAFSGIYCTSPRDCVAAGSRQTSKVSAVALIYKWDGKSWSDVATPNPTGALWAELDSVHCFSATECLVLGDADNSVKASGYFFVEDFNGKSWALGAVKNTVQFNLGNETGLFGLSCPKANSCLAVGSALGYTHGELGADFPAGVAEAWGGSTWKAVQVPRSPALGSYVTYQDSCLAPGNCWAVAGYPGIVGMDHPVPLLHWNGTSFSVTTLGMHGYMAAIGCLNTASGAWCVTLGESVSKSKGAPNQPRASFAGGYFA